MEGYKKIKEEIDSIAKECGREGGVKLIAVTKTVDEELIKKSIEEGASDIGENKPQELLKRMEQFGDKVRYHLIGNLQRNKVRTIVGSSILIHSVNSVRLLREIEKRSEIEGVTTEIMMQLNLAKEETKTGMPIEEMEEFLEEMSQMKHTKMIGMMVMGPNVDDEDEIRRVFKKAYNLKEEIAGRNLRNIEMRELSMGMSSDYRIAIEEGSTMVRIGSLIYGERHY